ncbi:MAG: methionyl-tRNA formyltransferase [Candidatus Niyogibacteria bacterium]|nr:methionyl-tRNA formyltransferase [Candidatus Niyogibacteria bacterium]
MNKPRIVFFGTPLFAVIVLEALKNEGLLPIAIITVPDAPAGRGLNPAPSLSKTWAQENAAPILQPIKLKDESFLSSVKDLRPDLFVVASYGKIVPPQLLAIPPKGTINVHPSLIPKYRGPSPIEGAMLADEEKTGVTILLTDELMDHGPILAQEELNAPLSDLDFAQAERLLAELGGKLLVKTIPLWIAGKITPQEQKHADATYTKKILKEDGHLDWNENAAVLSRKIRTLNPWPGTFTFWFKNKKQARLIIVNVDIVSNSADKKLGEVFLIDGQMAIACGNGALSIKNLRAEGKKTTSSEEFLRGNSSILGQILR